MKPGTRVANPYPETPAEKGLVRQLSSLRFEMGPADGAVTRTDLNFMEEVDGLNQPCVVCKDDSWKFCQAVLLLLYKPADHLSWGLPWGAAGIPGR